MHKTRIFNEFISNKSIFCRRCKEEISQSGFEKMGSNIDTDGKYVWRGVKCNRCNDSWLNIYYLSDIEEYTTDGLTYQSRLLKSIKN